MADDVTARNSYVHYVIVGSNHVECFSGSTVSAGRSHRRSIIYSLLYNNCPEPVDTEAERVEGWFFLLSMGFGFDPTTDRPLHCRLSRLRAHLYRLGLSVTHGQLPT